MPNISNVGARMQDRASRLSRETILFAGRKIGITTKALSTAQANEWLPEGSRNTANADPRIFDIAATVSTLPGEKSQVTWRGADYQVVRAFVAGSGAVWRCIVYRSPLPNTADTNPTTHARNDFRPPPATTA
jgi:hypothetical protein